MAELTCPKCQSPMRNYERSGVTVDQCSGCGGLFLDRGELERLTQAEDTHYGGGQGGGQSGGYGGGYGGQRGSGGFLGGLFGGEHGGRRGGHH